MITVGVTDVVDAATVDGENVGIRCGDLLSYFQ